MTQLKFDPEFFPEDDGERELADKYERLARYEAFDKLIDMVLDGVITLQDAKVAWESEELVFE